MDIYWPDNIDALNNAIARSEYNKVKRYIYGFHYLNIIIQRFANSIFDSKNNILLIKALQKLEINELKVSKQQKLKELENDFKEKQMKMSEEIKSEIREELKLHDGKEISISEISQLTEKITKTKLKLFETEIADYLEKMKLSYDLGRLIKIFYGAQVQHLGAKHCFDLLQRTPNYEKAKIVTMENFEDILFLYL